jgi:hypothetical protein
MNCNEWNGMDREKKNVLFGIGELEEGEEEEEDEGNEGRSLKV